MMRKSEISVRQAFWQLPVLILLAAAVGLCVNHWRSEGIPVIGDWSEAARFSDASGKSMAISLDQTRQLFEQNSVLFVDARPADQYVQGHIQGAMNIPWQEVDSYFEQNAVQLESADKIVTYCDGETCELSHDLALFLKETGFENVRVLVNGWSIWHQAGLPVEGENF